MTFVEALDAPEHFVDAVPTFSLDRGVVRLVLVSVQPNPDADRRPLLKVVGRLAMPEVAAAGLAAGLYDFLVKRGVKVPVLGPPAAPSAGTTVN